MPFTIKIIGTTQGPATDANPAFTTVVEVVNNGESNQWVRADLGVRIGETVIVDPNDISRTWDYVTGESVERWSIHWTGRWSSTHVITARLWISGDTPAPGYQPDVQIDSDSATVTVGLRLVLPTRGRRNPTSPL